MPGTPGRSPTPQAHKTSSSSPHVAQAPGAPNPRHRGRATHATLRERKTATGEAAAASLQPSTTICRSPARPDPGWAGGRGGLASRTGKSPEDKPGPDRARAQGRPHRLRTRDGSGQRAALHRGVGAGNAGGRERPPRLQPEPPYRTRARTGKRGKHTPARKRKSSAAQHFPATERRPRLGGTLPRLGGGRRGPR